MWENIARHNKYIIISVIIFLFGVLFIFGLYYFNEIEKQNIYETMYKKVVQKEIKSMVSPECLKGKSHE